MLNTAGLGKLFYDELNVFGDKKNIQAKTNHCIDPHKNQKFAGCVHRPTPSYSPCCI